jgi:hypothetical protein
MLCSQASSRSKPETRYWFKELAGYPCTYHPQISEQCPDSFYDRFALQFAIASGATVIATSSSDEKLKTVTKLGAKHVINYKTTPNWAAEVMKLTGGVGVDRVIEVQLNSSASEPNTQFHRWEEIRHSLNRLAPRKGAPVLTSSGYWLLQ